MSGTRWESPIEESERYGEWVRWSGTSFAAPAVVGALARATREKLSGKEAIERLIDDPGLFRIPGPRHGREPSPVVATPPGGITSNVIIVAPDAT